MNVKFLTSAPSPDHLPEAQAFEIALVGRSNVGKSTLVNFLAQHKNLARVSRTPGHTRLINVFSVSEANQQCWLLDLPGYGYAAAAKSLQKSWFSSMEQLFVTRRGQPFGLGAVLFLVDCRRELASEDLDLHQWFVELGLKTLIVQTKSDKLNAHALAQSRLHQASVLGCDRVVSVSSLKKMGRHELLTATLGLMH